MVASDGPQSCKEYSLPYDAIKYGNGDLMQEERSPCALINGMVLDSSINSLCVTPVSLGVQIAELKKLLLTEMDLRNGPTDLSRHECFAASRALVVEKNAVHGEHSVRFAIVHSDPIGVQFRATYSDDLIEYF